MDRRSLLFVLCVGFIIFSTQFYFGIQKDEQMRKTVAAQQKIDEAQELALKENVEKKSLPLSALPIAALYEDQAQEHYFGRGVLTNQTLLVFHEGKPPQTIYGFDGEGNSLGVFSSVDSEVCLKGFLTLYAQSSDSQLPSFSFSQLEDEELYLLSNSPSVFNIIYAQNNDQHVTIPLVDYKEDSLVLGLKGKEWIPLGVYEANHAMVYPLTDFSKIYAHVAPLTPLSLSTGSQEQFYVLQNDTMQLVFSSKGGALAEANLVIKKQDGEASIVQPIEVDHYLEKNVPQSSYFPQKSYWTCPSGETEPVFQTDLNMGGYYPLLRRSLDVTGYPKVVIPAQYYAFNLVSHYPELSETMYKVTQFSSDKIVFESTQPFRKIVKTYEIDKKIPYMMSVSIKVEGDKKGIWISGGIPEVELVSGSSGATLQYRITDRSKSKVEKLDLPKDVTKMSSVNPDWISNSNGFFGLLVDPSSSVGGFQVDCIPGNQVPTRLGFVYAQSHKYPIENFPGYLVKLPLDPSGQMNLRCYAGPYDVQMLEKVDEALSSLEGVSSKEYKEVIAYYGFTSFISAPFSKFLDVVMKGCYWLTHSWILTLFLTTLLLRVLLSPLNSWSMRSMKKMQEIAPQVTSIQKKHKKDPKKGQLEILQLYKENKVNPLGGCLPIVIQIPFLMGMLDLLRTSFPLRGASVIPGWIENLAAPDVICTWNYSIPFIGNSLHLLPLVLGALMFVQQRLMSPLPKDSSTWTEQQRQQRLMGNMMTFVLAFVFYHFPSGLNIYWLFSTLLQLAQQWWMNKKTKSKPSSNSDKIHPLNKQKS